VSTTEEPMTDTPNLEARITALEKAFEDFAYELDCMVGGLHDPAPVLKTAMETLWLAGSAAISLTRDYMRRPEGE